MASDMYNRIFIYSAQQANALRDIYEKNGKKYHLGTVVANGSEKKYTAIIRNMAEVQYSDAVKLIEGDIRHITYTSPSM